MIPITRKEKYINEIVGGGDTAPKTPQTREEFFFAEILGEVIAPSPVTRVEKYLSAIAGQYSNELPEPVTRIEKFIARAAGMDVTTPTPITREEMLWSNYSAIVEFEIEGAPPLTFIANGEPLKDWSISGNTGGVGDRTRNLFNGDLLKGYWSNTTDLAQTSSEAFRSFQIFLPAGTYTISFESNVNIVRLITDGALTQNVGNNLAEYTVTTQTDGNIGFSFRLTGATIVSWDNSDIMLTTGSIAAAYEPYGYQIPVTCGGITTNIYLDAPLGDGNTVVFAETSIRIPTLEGTNVLSIGTTVQPSKVYIKGEKGHENS